MYPVLRNPIMKPRLRILPPETLRYVHAIQEATSVGRNKQQSGVHAYVGVSRFTERAELWTNYPIRLWIVLPHNWCKRKYRVIIKRLLDQLTPFLPFLLDYNVPPPSSLGPSVTYKHILRQETQTCNGASNIFCL